MRIFRAAVYTLALACANAAWGGALDPSLLVGPMQKLVPSEGRALPEVALLDMDEGVAALPRGQWQVVNFWATWCVPCREEMPALEALAVAKIRAFMAEVGVSHLGLLRDPRQQFAHQAGVLGLPVTVIVDPEGREVARLIGGADWGSAEARAVLARLME
jgi:thiol-disulfide isomerase/thioredoxin